MSKKTTKKTTKKDSAINKYKKIAEDANEKHVRLLAEFDNFKKRTFQEKQDSLKYEGQDIVQSILPIIDDLNRVLEIKEIKKNDSIYKGINLVIDKFNNVLENNNIIAYESMGKTFNPDLHEALMTKKVKNKKNIIVDVYQSGYKYHDKVIRHAKVIVGE